MKLTARHESFGLQVPFVTAHGTSRHVDVVSVSLASGSHRGRGECRPYARYGESVASVLAQIESVRAALESGAGRVELQSLLPAGAARNALDCALWDLQAKLDGVPVWQLAGLRQPQAMITAFTLSLDEPAAMQAAASRHRRLPILKVKLGGKALPGESQRRRSADLGRLQAVRDGAPDSVLIVDANEAWSAADYRALAPALAALRVVLLEQPLPAGDDTALLDGERPLPVCADESCHDRDSLALVKDRYDFINIKLDKTGGLTEALALRAAAQRAGLRVMVGCMVSSSLAIAPAMLLAQNAEIIDLDAPLLLADDRQAGIRHDGAMLYPAEPALWG